MEIFSDLLPNNNKRWFHLGENVRISHCGLLHITVSYVEEVFEAKKLSIMCPPQIITILRKEALLQQCIMYVHIVCLYSLYTS